MSMIISKKKIHLRRILGVRAELVLGQLEGGHAVLYSSGMATVFAALHHYNPKRVVINKGYHGTLIYLS